MEGAGRMGGAANRRPHSSGHGVSIAHAPRGGQGGFPDRGGEGVLGGYKGNQHGCKGTPVLHMPNQGFP
jgi:hypothetical protein